VVIKLIIAASRYFIGSPLFNVLVKVTDFYGADFGSFPAVICVVIISGVRRDI